ncbi:hypothetical protein OG592_33880 [Streptomyces avidinii]|uniref:hypothetical protein n=1 Tax=Streptomyces avidinii TaxID=1895 RepID=UPI00386E38AB|nr:hypothetical protein OG592_33880 [Streptomyces avidinii]
MDSDTAKCAETMAGDRDLKLGGYEVFRFGTTNSGGQRHAGLLEHFLPALFERFRVSAWNS